jgi:hypothetical protein
MLYEDDLFGNAFKTKYIKNATTLRIVSGYATPSMLQHHIEAFPKLKISILLGMTSKDGIQLFHHKKFTEIEQNNANIECYYNAQCPHIHSKIYLWEATDGSPLYAVMGSANYTINGLISSDQKEILCDCDPKEAQNYINNIYNTCSCVKCTDANIKRFIKIEEYSPKQNNRKTAKKQKTAVFPTLPYVDLSLLRSDGKMYGEGGGINWGQREGRDPNQSYIAIPAPIQRQKFFPPKGEIFNVLANKTQFMRMVVAQGPEPESWSRSCESILMTHFGKSPIRRS